MPSDSDIRAVTVDALGTLLEIEDPVEPLRAALAAEGIDRDRKEVKRAFAAEVAHYVPRSVLGKGEASLAALRRECVGVFLRELEADLDAAGFVGPFVGALVFRPVTGAGETLDRLRRAGLRLACVANWDYLLPYHIARAGFVGAFETIVSSAEAGAAKPDPRIFQVALGRLGVDPARAVHVGDDEVDREGALAAGLRFEPAPLVTLPKRLGL
jgi:putative hydrolase of the HAD superfamily